ncbi:probable protein phosphatase 2C 6 isoform X2 [Solanum dulcamara]|uniref:probable protein phosphatase 2C 6 isoform X2 n=1 Tax=Solanum dulcamara TaxID=45834 RepID=UPI002485B1B3|nr:probable protein phosphatase 2C 6 isoform X2 [Solanum dulcamara]
MGICYSSSKSKSDDGLWDGKNDSRRSDSKLKKNSYSGDFSTFLSKLSGVGGGGGEDKGLHHIPGRILGNGATSRACLHTQQGKKGTNQDAMIVWENFCSRSDTIFCGVFDGHGPYGHMVARKVRDTLPFLLCSEWQVKSSGDQSNTSENGNTNGGSHLDDVLDDDLIEAMEAESNQKFPEIHLPLKRSMLKAFRSMDKELKLHPTIDCFCSGSTAVSLVMQGQDIIVGNVGDSRAVLATRDKDNYLMAVQLTVDLKPNLPREAARIHKYKGRVFALQDEPEVARVWLPNSDSPGLAMARAFGDFCLKDFGLISVPDVYYHRITDRNEFVVLATDGVWDVLSNKEAVDIVASAPSRATAARALVDCATRAWRLKYPTSKTDDCAVVCLFLDRVPAPDAVVTATQKTIVTDGNLESVDSNTVSASHIAVLEHSGTTKDASEIVPVDESIKEPLADKGLGHSKRSLAECLSTAEDQEWSALDGVTRVNSLLSLPRFLSGDKKSASRRKW